MPYFVKKTHPSARTAHPHQSAGAILPKRIYFAPYQLAVMMAAWRRACVLCHQSLSVRGLICQACQTSIPTQLPPVSVALNEAGGALRIFALSYYQHPMNALITQFKDHERIDALVALVALIRTLPKPLHCTADNTVIVPVPTTMSRMRERGFNPVLILAKYLAVHWGIPLWQGVLRQDGERHQRGLDRQARLQNPSADFYLAAPVPTRQVIIFDDVVTTGATLAVMAELIKGVQPQVRLLGICLAHGTAEFGLHTQ